jgi:MFS transporter, PPP family, 3-phenylpropionic acid transporter
MPALYFLSYVPLGMIFPYLVTELEARDIQDIGFLLSMPSFILIVVAPLWGWLADWLQHTVRVLQISVWTAVVGLLGVVYFEPNWVWVGMLLYSIGWAPVAALSDAMTLEGLRQQASVSEPPSESSPESPKFKYGSIRQWGSIGYMVGVGIIGWFIGWGIVGGAIVTALLGLYIFTIPHVRVELPRPKWDSVQKLLKRKELLWILLCASLHFSVHLGSSSYIIKHAQEIGVSVQWASLAILLGVMVEIVVFQQAQFLERIAPNRLLVFSCALAIPRWVLMMTASEVWMVVLAQAVHGVTFGVFWLAVVRLVKSMTPPDLSATGQSLLSTSIGGVGAVGGIYGASWMVLHYSTTLFYAAATCVAVLATIGSMRVKWTPNPQ